MRLNERVRKNVVCSVTRKKSPNVYQSCPEMLSLEYFDTFTKIVRDLGKFKAKGLKSCPKSNKPPNLVTLVVC